MKNRREKKNLTGISSVENEKTSTQTKKIKTKDLTVISRMENEEKKTQNEKS